jgi:hypothetical protein
MNSRCSRFDHRLDQLEDIERSPKPGFRVGDDWHQPMSMVSPLQMADLVSPQQRVVNSLNYRRNTVRRVQALVGIHLAGQIGVGCHLPAAKTAGTLFAGYKLWSGYIWPAKLASAATCQPLR